MNKKITGSWDGELIFREKTPYEKAKDKLNENALKRDQELEDLEGGILTSSQEQRLAEYQEEMCTSRCGNDIDCPHEEQMIAIFMEEVNAKYNERNKI